jgi:hypothetical protein
VNGNCDGGSARVVFMHSSFVGDSREYLIYRPVYLRSAVGGSDRPIVDDSRYPRQHRTPQPSTLLQSTWGIIVEYLVEMNPVFLVPAAMVAVFVGYYVVRHMRSISGGEDDYEHDGEQTTKIRHEANL